MQRALDQLAQGVTPVGEGWRRHAAHTQCHAEVQRAQQQAAERKRLGLPGAPEQDRQRPGPRLGT